MHPNASAILGFSKTSRPFIQNAKKWDYIHTPLLHIVFLLSTLVEQKTGPPTSRRRAKKSQKIHRSVNNVCS